MNKQQMDHNVSQGMASYIDFLNELRLQELNESLNIIIKSSDEELNLILENYEEAKKILDSGFQDIQSLIARNQGGKTGLHGFIAEHAETNISNARNALEGLNKSVELLDDNGRVDLRVYGKDVQVKFYNNIVKMIRKSNEYTEMDMMFPSNHYETIDRIMQGDKQIEVDGNLLSVKKINLIKKQVEEAEALRGESYNNWMHSSKINYDQAQKNAINETFLNEQENIKFKYKNKQQNLKSKVEQEKAIVYNQSKANLKEAHNVGLAGGLMFGGMHLSFGIYKKLKEGKRPWEYDSNDFIELGLDFTKETSKGYISAVSIYGLTNVMNFSAPAASAITSGSFGLINSVILYRTNQIDDERFFNLVLSTTMDTTASAIGASIGQMLIPIPVLGALIGSASISTVLRIGENILNEKEIELLKKYDQEIENHIKRLDEKYQSYFHNLIEKFKKINDLQEVLLDVDFNLNIKFQSSIDLARFLQVDDQLLLDSVEKIDNYFMN